MPVSSLQIEVKETGSCIATVKVWMHENKLLLNEPKTEYMILGKASNIRALIKPPLIINDFEILPSREAMNLGVIFDDELTLSNHVSSLCNRMFGQIRSICLYRKYMTVEVASQLMVSLVLSKIDYCNSLLAGLPDNLLNKLQRVQNCAAKVCLNKKKYDHVTPLLITLHWLPVKERIEYKVATLCFKYFDGSLPLYLSDLLKKPLKVRELRSSKDETLLFVPLKNMTTYGERAFDYFGPKTWNSLPKEIREIKNLNTFKRSLKHYLFTKAFS